MPNPTPSSLLLSRLQDQAMIQNGKPRRTESFVFLNNIRTEKGDVLGDCTCCGAAGVPVIDHVCGMPHSPTKTPNLFWAALLGLGVLALLFFLWS